MATFQSAAFSDGDLATSEGVIYKVPPNLNFTSKSIFFYNSNAADQTINVYLRNTASGTSRQIRRIVLKQNESYVILGEKEFIPLNPGDTIRADTTTSSAVKYSVIGALESP